MISYKQTRYTLLGLLSGLLPLVIAWPQFKPVTAQTTTIPLGSYTAVLNEVPNNPLFSVGQYQITFLEGGKFRYQMNDKIIAAGSYTLTADRVELTLPAGVDACASKGVYQWSLQGNKLSLALPTGQSDGCVRRTGMVNTFFRTDQLESLWKQAPPRGGTRVVVFFNDGKLFAATNGGGIFVSTDAGANWRATRSPRGLSIYAFAAFNGNLFAGASGGVILLSTDGGEDWEFYEPNLALIATFQVRDFAVFNGKLYAAAPGQGVLRTTDNPYLWEKAGMTGLTNLAVTSLAVIGAQLFAGTDGGGVFVSTDGNTWAAVNNGLTFPRIYTLAVSGTTLYAGTANGSPTTTPNEVFVTQNNGLSWQRVGNGLANGFPGALNAVYDLLPLNGKLFAATTSGVLVNDGGLWTRIWAGFYSTSHTSLAGSGNQLFAGGEYDGFARSLDSGATWSLSNNVLFGRAVTSMLNVNNVVIAGTNGVILWSTDEAQSFGLYTAFLNGIDFSRFLAFNSKIFAGTSGGATGAGVGIWAQTQGVSFARASNGLPTGNVTELIAVGNVLYTTILNGGVFRSPDSAQNWTAINNGLTSLRAVSLVARSSMLFVGTENAGVFRSTNDGQNWTVVNNGLPAGAISALASSGNNLLAAVYGQGIYRSSDNGDTWMKSADGFNHPFVYRMYATGNTVFASGNNGLGVIRSTDNGQTWGFVNAGFDAHYAYDFFVSGAILYAATPNGIYTSNMLINPLANVSAANYSASAITEKSIVAMYGVNLAANVASAGTVPLPTSLLGTSVKIRDSNGVERLAPLFFVSGGQVNYQIPAGTATGTAIVSTVNGDGIGAISSLEVRAIAPSVFTANASGSGAAAALDAIKYTPAPFDAKLPNGDPNVIAVFGTGLGSDATDVAGDVNATVTARMDGNSVTLLYAGQAPGLVGANQFNVVLPATITSGVHTLTFTRGGVTSNTTTLAIR